jgi:hypothetical protein
MIRNNILSKPNYCQDATLRCGLVVGHPFYGKIDTKFVADKLRKNAYLVNKKAGQDFGIHNREKVSFLMMKFIFVAFRRMC